jgi:Ca2+-binding EF-hand superfamily protein
MTISSATSSTSLAQLRQLQQTTFKTADADGDGQLTRTEFQSIGQNVQGSGREGGPPPMRGGGGPGGNFSGDTLSALLSTQSVDDVANSVMSAGDADGDGSLSASEIASALSANAPEDAAGLGIEEQMASDIVAALDSDGDGALSTTEIASAISNASGASSTQATRGPPPGPPPGDDAGSAGSSGVFESLDANQDGVVSADELAAANGSDGADATSAASDLIAAADQDGDGSLSGEEFHALLDAGKATTESASSLASLISGSTTAADLMQKLLAQLDTAMTASSGATSGASVTV